MRIVLAKSIVAESITLQLIDFQRFSTNLDRFFSTLSIFKLDFVFQCHDFQQFFPSFLIFPNGLSINQKIDFFLANLNKKSINLRKKIDIVTPEHQFLVQKL